MIATAFVLGLLGSLHCMGMCGPIAFMLPLDREKTGLRFLQLGLYHAGRLLAYGGIGLVFGLAGRGLYLFGFQQKLSIVLGGVIILLVLIPTRVFRGSRLLRPFFRIQGRIQGVLGRQLKAGRSDTYLSIGLLNGLLPCGLVYMALAGAMAQASAAEGAAFMLVFGTGTLPLMSAAALFGRWFKGRTTPVIRRMLPVAVAAIGVLFILRGLGLGIPYLSPDSGRPGVTATQACLPDG